MKRIALFALLLSTTWYCENVNAQTAAEIAALSSFLPADKISYLQGNNQDLLKEMAWINKHGYYVSDMQGQKDISSLPDALLVEALYENAPSLNESAIINGSMNMLAYRFNLQPDTYNYYRIGQSDKVLVIMSQSEARKAFLNAQ